MRTCVVHIGTHKTGTTSLQMALSRHSASLQRHNYLYPRTGRPPGAADGHHNIAWELSGDRRFRPEYGAVADLLAEVRDSDQDVILSSEDFECSVLDPCGFEAFVRLLRANHFAIRVIVYLRNQVDYAESLYQTMLPFGVPDSFSAFLRKILEDGLFCWQEWVFPFCYRSLLTRLEALEDVTVDVRSYDKLAHGAVIGDYLSVLRLDPAALEIDESIRANARAAPLDSVRRFCENGRGAPLDRIEQHIVACLCESMGPGPLRISEISRLKIADRFRESNAYVRKRYGVQLTNGEESVATVGEIDETPQMEAIFSEYFRRSVDRLADLFRGQVLNRP
jgi:hypothetical protein